MPIQHCGVFSSLHIPDSDGVVWGCTHELLALGIVFKTPDTLLVTFESRFTDKLIGVPEFDGMIVGAGCKLFFVFWVSLNSINRIRVNFLNNLKRSYLL